MRPRGLFHPARLLFLTGRMSLGWTNTLNGIIFTKNLLLAGAFVILAAFRAGAWTVDVKRKG